MPARPVWLHFAGMRIGDEPLTPSAVAAAARAGAIDVALTDGARERMAAAHRRAAQATRMRPVYGRTTGVGANRSVLVEGGDEREHGLRLLRSHAGGMGEPLPPEVVRATIVIRLAQLTAGGAGQRPELADALVALLHAPDDELPVLHDLGGLGTGDLTVLGELGLALPAIEEGDALALMSSNAATFAVATLAWHDLGVLLDAGLGVAALSFAAVEGNAEAYAPEIGAGRPLPGAVAVAARMRALVAEAGVPARIQDPFALRCVPQVGGALHAALGQLRDLLAIEVNAASENPLIAGEDVLHHGGFHAASCALALDSLRLAVVPFGTLSAARLRHLMEPGLTGLTPFLSGDAPGSSGVLIAEYVAADALARLRATAAPAVLGLRDALARAGGARELRVAGGRPGAPRRRSPADRPRARVGRRRARAADEGERRLPGAAQGGRALRRPAGGPAARRRRRDRRGGAPDARRGRARGPGAAGDGGPGLAAGARSCLAEPGRRRPGWHGSDCAPAVS